MYNLRYHIASLMAVFLALAVGLLLGTIVVERGVLSSLKTTQLDRLNQQYDRITKESQSLKEQADALESFADEAWPEIVRGKLAGRRILVLADPASTEEVEQAAATIKGAGGVPVIVTFAGPGMKLSDPDVRVAAAAALGVPAESDLETGVVAQLASEWSSAESTQSLTKTLVQAGGIERNGPDGAGVAGGVVVAAAWGSTPDTMAVALGKALQAPDRRVVGVESSARPTGMMRAMMGQEMSGVEDVTSALGRISMVWVLAGRAAGGFGSGAGADAVYPTPLFPAQ